MIAQLYYLFIGIHKSKNQLISLDTIEFIIANTLKFLFVIITELYIFLDYGTDEEIYKHIHRTILDGNMMNMYLIIMEVKYGAIDTDDSSCHGYYIIKFSSSPYNLK